MDAKAIECEVTDDKPIQRKVTNGNAIYLGFTFMHQNFSPQIGKLQLQKIHDATEEHLRIKLPSWN